LNYEKLETFFDENKFTELLELYKSDLENADEYSNLFSNNALVSPGECQEALTVLTGLYMKFNTIYHIADYKFKQKEQISKVSTGDKESLMTTACYRIKMIFKGYCDNMKKGVSIMQSQLKYWSQELQLTK
jgi:hypothetical protein